MPEKFDPLHLWLGISKEEQPPHYYRLLGLEPFETDPDVIENAAERQQMHVRSVATPERQAIAQKLLAAIKQAQVCLLTPERRAEYDARLQAKLDAAAARKSSPGQAAPSKVAKPSPPQPEKPSFDIEASDPRLSKLRQRTSKATSHVAAGHHRADTEEAPAAEKKGPPIVLMAAIGGGVLALILIVGVGVMMMGGDKPQLAQADSSDSDPAANLFAAGTNPDTSPPPTGQKPPEDNRPASGSPGGTPVDNHPPADPPSLPTPGGNDPAPSTPGLPTPGQGVIGTGAPPTLPPRDPPVRPVADPPANQGQQLPSVGENDPGLPSAIPTPTEPPQPDRQPLPEPAALEELRKQVNELFEVASARTPADRLALIERLLEQAQQSQDAPAERYAILEVALDQAKEAEELRTAFEIIERQAADYQIDPLPLKANTLATVRPIARDAEANKEHLDLANSLLQQSVAGDQFEQALTFNGVMLETARRLKDSDLIKQIAAFEKQLRDLTEEQAEISAAMTKLEEYADDPAENLKVGRYLCLRRGEWLRGASNLAKGADRALAETARLELAPPKSAADQVSLADSWWRLAGETKNEEDANSLRHRAVHWYRQALPSLSGLERTKVERQLAAVPPLRPLDSRRRMPLAPQAGLVLHYPFDTVRGSLTPDESGSGHHGQLLNAPTLVKTGVIGGCLKFNATAQAVRITELESLPSLTLSLWAYNAATTSQPFNVLLNHDLWAANSMHFQIKGDDGVDVGIHRGANSFPAVRTTGGVSRHGSWQHFAVTVDSESGRVMVYADGEPVGAGSIRAGLIPQLAPGQIGSWRNPNEPRSFTGLIDDVRIYNRAFSAEEVALLTSLAEVETSSVGSAMVKERPLPTAQYKNQPFLAYIYVRERSYPEYGGGHSIPLAPGSRCRLWPAAPTNKPGGFGLEICNGPDRNWSNIRLVVEPIEPGKFLVRCVDKNAGSTHDLLGPDGRMLIAKIEKGKSAVVEMPQN